MQGKSQASVRDEKELSGCGAGAEQEEQSRRTKEKEQSRRI